MIESLDPLPQIDIEEESPHGVHVIVDMKKAWNQKTLYRLISASKENNLNFAQDPTSLPQLWVRLQRGSEKPGLRFRLLRKVVD